MFDCCSACSYIYCRSSSSTFAGVCCDISKTVAANQLTELVVVHPINLLFRVLLACWLGVCGGCANMCILCSCGNEVVLETSLLLRNGNPRTPCSRVIRFEMENVLRTAGHLVTRFDGTDRHEPKQLLMCKDQSAGDEWTVASGLLT